ncbi:MAG: YbaN family protein [Microvirga sp.]|nr:YbaN family protein [Microvirga sp.]
MRRLYRSAAYASLALGAIGVVAPVLPTTPFVILAAWCFARSDPHLAEKLYEHPTFGPYLRNWRDEGAIPLRAKVMAIGAMAASFVISVITVPFAWVPFVLGPIMAAVAIWIATRPRPKPVDPVTVERAADDR